MEINWADIAIGTVAGAVISIPAGLAVNKWWEDIQRRTIERDRNIKITSAANDATLKNELRIDGLRCFEISGHLGFLMPDHEIWLLTRDLNSKYVWPQGFRKVVYREETGSWSGYVHARNPGTQLGIIAVVAPPTSQQFFRYFQEHGRETGWSPLSEIPSECVNQANILVWV